MLVKIIRTQNVCFLGFPTYMKDVSQSCISDVIARMHAHTRIHHGLFSVETEEYVYKPESGDVLKKLKYFGI